jgi:acetyl esterase
MGNLDLADGTCRHLAQSTQCVVVSVGYRLAPECKYPAAVEDAYAALRWVSENSAKIAGIPGSIAVGGESSGGNLAAAAALMARDLGGPAIVFQLLIYPVIEPDFTRESYVENGSRYGPSVDLMRWFWNHYLRTEADALEPYASPIRAESLRDLPPALVITGEYDALRDEGEAYARKLQEAGVPVTLSRYDGMIHLFFLLSDKIDKGQMALNEAAQALRTTLQIPWPAEF